MSHHQTADDQCPGIYFFPLSKEGIEVAKNIKEILKNLRTKWREVFPNPAMRFPYTVGVRNENDSQRRDFQVVRVCCSICTNVLIYERNIFKDSEYRLTDMKWYHKHKEDPALQEKILSSLTHHPPHVFLRNRIDYEENIESNMYIQEIDKCIKELPKDLSITSLRTIVCQRFGISQSMFQKRFDIIRSRFDETFMQMISRFEENQYEYHYLPDDLLEVNREYIRKRRQKEMAQHPDPSQRPKNIYDVDLRNPELPNVLLVVTPQMKERYYRFGQYVGFDLTFSLIKQRPWLSEKEYLLGAFAGTTQSRRIMIYGLVCTSTPSEEAYYMLFKWFIEIMGGPPPTFVTDEQKPIYYAIRRLRKEGLFNGSHLFDMFHILKKIRKGVEPQNFQLIRKMMHARDRIEYRRLFSKLIENIKSEQELRMVKLFDYHSEKFCFTQIDNSFVGLGISDAMNEKFHDFVKTEIPYETTYMRVIGTTLELIERLNNRDTMVQFENYPIEEKLNYTLLKSYRTKLADKSFHYLLKEIYKALPYQILSQEEEIGRQNGMKPRPKPELHYMIDTLTCLFTVFWQNERWQCNCDFQQKSGYPCSHICKVLLTRGQSLFGNIEKRWLIGQNGAQSSFKKLNRKYNPNWIDGKVKMRKLSLIGNYQAVRQSGNYQKYTVPVALHTVPNNNQLDYNSESAFTINETRSEMLSEDEESEEVKI